MCARRGLPSSNPERGGHFGFRARDETDVSCCLTLADFERYSAGLSEAAAQTIKHHLQTCDACRVAYERFRHDQAFLIEAKSALTDDSDSRPGTSVAPGSARRKPDARVPQIEGYDITGVIGQGGMGIVYRALQRKLNRTVALKVLPAMVGAASPSAVSRFRREATAAARLHHTNIVPIYDFGESYDAYYYAMELIVGQPLNVVIKQLALHHAASVSPAQLAELIFTITSEAPSVPELPAVPSHSGPDPSSISGVISGGRGRAYYRQVAHWIADVADGLQYAHDQGIIHRDIKPANLILSETGRLMIADFGLAKSSEDESVTITGSLLGTVRYLSPEQAMARRMPVDHRTDVYSLGATLYEMLCFQPAFPGEDDKQILSSIITRDPTVPRKIAPSVPPDLETICLKTLEKRAEERYPTARAFAEDLRRYTDDLPIVARRPGAAARVLKFVRRHKGGTVAVVSLLIAAMTIPVMVHYHNKSVVARVEELRNEAQILAGRGQWGFAAQAYEEALQLDADHAAMLHNYAEMLKKQYNSLPMAARDPALLKKALALVTQSLDVNANQPEAWNTKGVLHKKFKQYAEAIASYEQAIRLGRANARENAQAWENLGNVNALEGNLEKAEQDLRQAGYVVGKLSGSETIWCSLASLQMLSGGPDTAELLDSAAAINASHPWVLLLQVRYALRQGDPPASPSLLDDAKFASRQAQQSDPKNVGKFQRILALAHLRSGEPQHAIDAAWLAIEAGDLETPNQLVISIAHLRLGQVEKWQWAIDLALDQWPEDLKEPGQRRAAAPPDYFILWFDTYEELRGLLDEARRLLEGARP